MPQNPSAWSAWNFLGTTEKGVYLTYWLNVLQVCGAISSLSSSIDFYMVEICWRKLKMEKVRMQFKYCYRNFSNCSVKWFFRILDPLLFHFLWLSTHLLLRSIMYLSGLLAIPYPQLQPQKPLLSLTKSRVKGGSGFVGHIKVHYFPF